MGRKGRRATSNFPVTHLLKQNDRYTAVVGVSVLARRGGLRPEPPRREGQLPLERENLRVLASPLVLPLSMLAEDHAEADASATVATLASLAQSKHLLGNLVTFDRPGGRTPIRLHLDTAGTDSDVL